MQLYHKWDWWWQLRVAGCLNWDFCLKHKSSVTDQSSVDWPNNESTNRCSSNLSLQHSLRKPKEVELAWMVIVITPLQYSTVQKSSFGSNSPTTEQTEMLPWFSATRVASAHSHDINMSIHCNIVSYETIVLMWWETIWCFMGLGEELSLWGKSLMLVTENMGHHSFKKMFSKHQITGEQERCDLWLQLKEAFYWLFYSLIKWSTGTENILNHQVIRGLQTQYTQANKRFPEIKQLKSVHCVNSIRGKKSKYRRSFIMKSMQLYVSVDSTEWGVRSPIITPRAGVRRNPSD